VNPRKQDSLPHSKDPKSGKPKRAKRAARAASGSIRAFRRRNVVP